MTDREAIKRCRDLGWYIAETKKFRGKPHGVYRFRWPDDGTDYDYSAYIDTTDGTPFAEAVTRLAQRYLAGEDAYKTRGVRSERDWYTNPAVPRVREAMNEVLEAMKEGDA